MTYDEWKLETPEDEAKRRRGRNSVFGCTECDWLNGNDEECEKCGCCDLEEIPMEQDPDDARDAERDR